MSIQIKLKNSVVQDSTPSTSDLPAVGEIALNANINSIGGFMRASDNSIVKIFGPGSLSTPTATTTVSGISELATSAETTTGSATNRVVTPAGLNAVTVAERTTSNNNYVAKAGSTLTGVLTMPNGSNSAPAINFGDSDSGIFGGTNTVSLSAGGTTRLTADTGVSVVGTLAVTGAITSTSDLTIAEKIIHSGDTDTFFSFPAANIAAVDTAGSERLRVDASGRLLLGTTAPRSPAAVNPHFQIEGTNAASSSLSLTRNSANTGGPNLIFNKTRGTAVGADTSVNAGDTLGFIIFAGNDGTDSDSVAASITAKTEGTPSANDMPGRLEFGTTADGEDSVTERMRITSLGRVGIGTNSPDVRLDVARLGSAWTGPSPISGTGVHLHNGNNSANSPVYLTLGAGNTSISGIVFGDSDDIDVGKIFYEHTSNILRFDVNTAERMRIDSNGQVGIGTSSPSGAALHVSKGAAVVKVETTTSGNSARIIIKSPTDSYAGLHFGDADDEDIGRIRYYQNDNYMQFSTNASEQMRIDSSGRLLINNDSSTNGKLVVENNQNQIAVETGTSGDGRLNIGHFNNGTFIGTYGDDGGAADLIRFGTHSGDERMRIQSNGKVGIGISSPDQTLHVHKASAGSINSDSNAVITAENNTHCIFQMLSPNTVSNRIMFGDPEDSNRGEIQYNHSSDTMTFTTDGTESMRLTSNHQLLIGTSGTRSPGGVTGQFQIEGTNVSTSSMSLTRNSNDAGGCNFTFNKTRATSVGGDVAVSNNDTIGAIRWVGNDGANSDNPAAQIMSQVDGTTGTDDVGGDLSFWTTPDDSNTLQRRLHINNAGQIMMGTTTEGNEAADNLTVADTGNCGITIRSSTSTTGSLFFADGTAGLMEYRGFVQYAHADNTLRFGSNAVERARFTSSGLFGIGTTSPLTKLDVTGNSGTNPTMQIRHSAADVTGEFLRIARTDNVSIRYHSIKASHSGSAASNRITFHVHDGSGDPFTGQAEVLRMRGDGRVGIGETAPDALLHVKGTGNGSGAQAFRVENSDDTELFEVRNDGAFFTGTDGGSPYNFTTTSGANARLDSNGRLRRSTSSKRYKKDITDATWGLAEVLKLKPVTFKSNETGEGADDKTYAGFTAEDVHDLGLTEFVEYNASNEPDAIDYANMVSLLTNAIKELAAKVTKLEGA